MRFILSFRFSEVMNQMFLTVRGTVQGSLRARLCLASVFVHVVSHPGWVAWRCPTSPSGFFFGVNLLIWSSLVTSSTSVN